MDSPPDDRLMLDVREGDLRKLGVLFDRHQTKLFNYYLRLTGDRAASEDQVQEVFLRMLRFRHTYTEGASFVAWMYRIARNAHIDHVRKTWREVGLGHEDVHPALEPSVEQSLGADQEASLVRRALARLPRDRRELLVLSRFQNLKCEQIGEILGCRAGAVRGRVYRALRELRQIYLELSGGMAAVG
jgi:RNA polymerase sigma-70 factor (ECF subfamily)